MFTKKNKRANKPPKSRPPGLTERQRRFVDFYLQTGNLAESAKRAGYTARSASATGNELMRNPNVAAQLDARLKELESERVATAQEIQEYLTAVMRGEVEEDVVVNVGTGKGYTQADKVRAQVTAKDRNKAAELLAKVRGMFVTKSEVEVNGGLPIVIKDDM